jgi:hypothetical protein
MDVMSKKGPILLKLFILCLLSVAALSACNGGETAAPSETATAEVPLLTETPAQPSPTPMPAAAIVNGERIPLAWFESELARYRLAQEALGQPIEDEAAARAQVLNDIVDQVLLAQGAMQSGYSLSDSEVQARIDSLSQEVDLPAWMAEWGYTEGDLFQALKLQMLAAYQRELIAAAVPESADQVRLQQIFAYTQDGANNALLSLNSGAEFDDVAFLYDPVAGGHMGWVPRGYLLIPAVEEAAFNLPVGQYSEVIESEIGYPIVMVLDRAERPLTQDARLTLQRKALHDWLEDQRSNSQIEILID